MELVADSGGGWGREAARVAGGRRVEGGRWGELGLCVTRPAPEAHVG